jgi:predicted transposase YbfD/YdcC
MSYRIEKSRKESLDYRYNISPANLTQEQFSSAVRNHWGIENGLHWVLDTSMNEDKCQIYRDNGAEVLAVVRHIALNILRTETTKKASIKRKQKISAMNTLYLEKVLTAGIHQQNKK